MFYLQQLAGLDHRVVEVLRESIESGKITTSRAANQGEFPARFLLGRQVK